MSTFRKLLLVVGLSVIAVGGLREYGPAIEWSMPSVSWPWEWGTKAKLDYVVVVYESHSQPVGEASVLNGEYAGAINKVGKWRSYDKDELPNSLKDTVPPIIKKHGVPCLLCIRGGKVVASMQLPKSNDALQKAVESNGGF